MWHIALIKNRTKQIFITFKEISASPKKYGKTKAQAVMPTTENMQTAALSFVNGWHSVNKFKNPQRVNEIVAAVISSFAESRLNLPSITTAKTLNKSSKPKGKPFFKTFVINFPSIKFLFGCNAKKNDGKPITKVSSKNKFLFSKMNEVCVAKRIIESKIIINVFIKNRVDDF